MNLHRISDVIEVSAIVILGHICQIDSTLLTCGNNKKTRHPFSLISSADTCAYFTEEARKPSVSQKECNLSYYQKLN